MSAGHLRRDRTAVLPERARKIYAVCAHPLRALEPPFDLFPPPVQCGGCCALRATMIIRLRPYMAGPRPARSHCFRYFSQCLIFWCFWIKPKARKKESKRIFFRSILRETILPLRLCVSCKERIYHLLSPKGGAKSVRQAKSCGKLTAPR